MKELILLRSMWTPKVKRKTDLIVPEITHTELESSLNNDFWAFNVPFAFRSALDIKYEERKKDKKSYMVWTQGPLLNFKEADLIHSRCGNRALQVKSATPMSWDLQNNKMHEGNVFYLEYEVNNQTFSKKIEHATTQMQFLQLLIQGDFN